ncbi:hypothetical protein QBZ16_004272 [Prototheca wickerhamii]|uniref:KTI12-like protein n=1 Tax=Prototheca wickerhamii TaxID=3111 RepID=A0AAD9IK00_PROWI|nr:hypothetical protein QBZ16_004272 [Prototheca wickerhamii]
MALVIICGQPASGKSTFAEDLRKQVEQHGKECRVISEDSLGIPRDQAYRDATAEKQTRGQLKSEVERSTTKQHVTVLDSINGIKGFRYELYCIARGAGVRYCMVHVDASAELCRRRNGARADSYPGDVLEDLLGRFERPDSKFRWEAPLFTLRVNSGEAAQPALQATLACALDLARPLPADGGDAIPVPQTAPLKPTIATTNAKLSSTNLLHEIDQATQTVMEAVAKAQELRPGSSAGVVEFGPGVPALRLDRAVPIVELRRHRRAFLRLVTNLSMTRAPDAATARRMFVDFLASQLAHA